MTKVGERTMDKTKAFGVSFIGFSERERRILRSLTALSTARCRHYSFREPDASTPDLYLIDGDDPAAIATWKTDQSIAPAPAAFVVDRDRPDLGRWFLRRPIVPSRLFALLDQMTVQELRYLPELHIGRDSAATTAPIEVAAETAKSAGRALVVDDSPTVRKQIELGLRLLHVGVDFAETGEQGLALFAVNAYDIVFLDVVLPGIDGYQVCRTIKKDKLRKHTPVVMLTGRSSAFDRVKGSLAGCDTYLTKPVENSVFQSVLKKYLKVGEPGYTHGCAMAAPALR